MQRATLASTIESRSPTKISKSRATYMFQRSLDGQPVAAQETVMGHTETEANTSCAKKR